MSKLRTSSIETVVASQPVNGTAARVMGRGVHWEPPAKVIEPWHVWSDTPLPTFPVPPSAPDLTGFKVCRLTVVGYGGPGSGGAKWVVRCACGAYGHNKAKFLYSEAARTQGMCKKCNYFEHKIKNSFKSSPER